MDSSRSVPCPRGKGSYENNSPLYLHEHFMTDTNAKHTESARTSYAFNSSMAFSALVSVTTPTVAARHLQASIHLAQAAVAVPSHGKMHLALHICCRRSPLTISYEDEHDDARLDKHAASPISAPVNRALMQCDETTTTYSSTSSGKLCLLANPAFLLRTSAGAAPESALAVYQGNK